MRQSAPFAALAFAFAFGANGGAARCQAQTPASSDGASVYQAAAPSVFLIEMRDDTGAVQAIGSAFLVKGARLVTNAHVVREGRPFLRTGAARLPLRVDRIDTQNDLAVLSSATPLEAPELVLLPTEPVIGTTIFALGNPKGLERTISEGLVSGVREVSGRRLLQISAAISPGSSGGPIVTRDGRVVGVAVGYLEQGQNLNFAVPASKVLALLVGSVESPASFAVAAAAARELIDRPVPDNNDTLASNRYWRELAAGVAAAAASARTGDEYLAVAALAFDAGHIFATADAIPYAEEALRRKTTWPDSARALMMRAWGVQLFMGDTISPVRLRHMRGVADTVLMHNPKDASAHAFRGQVYRRTGAGEQAVADAAASVDGVASENDLTWYWSLYHQTMYEFGSASADNAVFRRMVAAEKANRYAWAIHADHLLARKDWVAAGDAYVQAYRLGEQGRAEYACKAGRAYYMSDSTDRALTAFRACVDDYATAPSFDTASVGTAHRLIAILLFDRGVYAQAESHARQAIALDAKDAWAFNALAKALIEEKRPTEAVAAAEQAIRLTDGGVASMHFTAGSAYFDLQDWPRCESAYRKADQLEQSGTAALYNMGLCLARQGFYRDAARAMENVLQRNPKRTDRADIESMIRRWRQ